MAPVLEKQLPGAAGAGDNNNEDEEGQNLWSSILSEVSTRSSSKLPSGKNILVFGEDGSGKTTLMAKLQGADHNKKGRGLEYLYLNVHDEDRDDLTRCNVWILDGDLYHKGLLKFAVSAQSLCDCLAVFVADMSRPWTIMESLQKWASVLRDHVDKLKIPPEDMREMEQKMVKAFQEYIEPEDATPSSPQRRAQTAGEDEAVVLPLGDNTLTHNLGIPVLIVCTKVNNFYSIESLECEASLQAFTSLSVEILSHPGHDYLEKSLRQGNWTLLKFVGKMFHFSSKKLLQFLYKLIHRNDTFCTTCTVLAISGPVATALLAYGKPS